MTKYSFTLFLVTLTILGCSQKKETKKTEPTISPESSNSLKATSLKVNDTLMITVKNIPAADQPTLNGAYVIPHSHQLKMPYLKHAINIKGKSCEALATTLEQAYIENHIYTSPKITVKILTSQERITIHRRYITVGGWVPKKGPILWKQGMTLHDALTLAGINELMEHQRLTLLRNRRKYQFDLKQESLRNLKLYPNDQVIIEQRDKL